MATPTDDDDGIDAALALADSILAVLEKRMPGIRDEVTDDLRSTADSLQARGALVSAGEVRDLVALLIGE